MTAQVPTLELLSQARRQLVWVLVGWLVVLVACWWIEPAGDDFGTLRPAPDLWQELRPGLFWRPFLKLLVYLVHESGWPFVATVQLVNGLGQGIAAVGLFTLLLRLGVASRVALGATWFFEFAPAGTAAVFSVDGGIQCWSTAFGLWALVALNSPGRFAVKAALGFVACALAALWKESGLGWFVAAPVLAFGWNSRGDFGWARLGWLLSLGVLGAACYLGFRFVSLDVAVGAEFGRYAVSLSPMVWVKNAVTLLGASASTVDTVALLAVPRNVPVTLLTLLGGLGLLLCVLRAAVGQLRRRLIGSCLIGFAALLGPHVLLTHVSEMYCHPFVALWLVVLLPAVRSRGDGTVFTFRPVMLVPFALATLISWGHKYAEIVRSGQRAHQVASAISNAVPMPRAVDPPVCLVVSSEAELPFSSYSVFRMSAGPASLFGQSVISVWGWSTEPRFRDARSSADCPHHVFAVIEVGPGGEVRVTR